MPKETVDLMIGGQENNKSHPIICHTCRMKPGTSHHRIDLKTGMLRLTQSLHPKLDPVIFNDGPKEYECRLL